MEEVSEGTFVVEYILIYLAVIVVVVAVVLTPFLIYAYARHKPKVIELTPKDGSVRVRQIMIIFRGTAAKLADVLKLYTARGWTIVQTDGGSRYAAIFTSRKWTVLLNKVVKPHKSEDDDSGGMLMV